jgi:hypothetical protein
VNHAAATEQKIIPLVRHDMHIGSAINYSIKEHNITDALIGLHKGANHEEFFRFLAGNILNKSREAIYVYKIVQPFNTLKRMLVAITPAAELEQGFQQWLLKVFTIARAGGMSLHFFAGGEVLSEVKNSMSHAKDFIVPTYTHFSNWEDFLILGREVKQNDFLVVVSSRKNHLSYNEHLEKLPYYLSRYFAQNSFIMLYPYQVPEEGLMDKKPIAEHTIFKTFAENLQIVNKAGGYFTRIFKKRNR